MKHTPRASTLGIILSLAIVIALSLTMSPAMWAADEETVPLPSFTFPTQTPPPVATEADLALDDMPLSQDATPGTITINVPLKYKTMPINYYGYQLQFLEVYPVFDNPSEAPFELTSSQQIQTLLDLKTTTVAGRPVTYLSFTFNVKADTVNDYYNIKFHARFMHQGSSLLYDKAAETDLVVPIEIVNGVVPTPTPTPTPLPTTAPPVSVPKIIISAFQTEPDIIMIGDEFDLTLSLFNTSKKSAVSNIKCTIDGDQVIVPVSGSNSFYIEKIGAEESSNYVLRMSAQPASASTTTGSAVGKSQYTVKVKMEYEFKGADSLQATSVEETFTIRIRQEVKVELNPARVDPSEVTDGDYFDVSMSLINKGKAAIYNLTARFEGPSVFRPDDVYFGGLVNPGESKPIMISGYVMGSGGGSMMGGSMGGMFRSYSGGAAVSVAVAAPSVSSGAVTEGSLPIGETYDPEQDAGEDEFAMPLSGPQECSLIITYEDEYGVETRESMPFTIVYTPADTGMDMDSDFGMMDPGGDMDAFNPDGGSQGASGPLGLSPWLFWCLAGLLGAGVLAGVALILRARVRRKGNHAVD